ncbi:hypothetical protein OIV83_004745 [Microbotryomycetes sp. JL201]|nr:hypothetical protein OIV83_004745 [Microbotryomycetes sp. JL201]
MSGSAAASGGNNNWDDLYGDLYGDDEPQSTGGDVQSAAGGSAGASAPEPAAATATGVPNATPTGAPSAPPSLPVNPAVQPLPVQNQYQPQQQSAPMAVDGARAPSTQRPTDTPDEGKMFIGGLNWDTTDESLRMYFEQFGPVTHSMIMRDAETGRSRGFAFLTFEDPKSVDAVLSKGREHFLDGKLIDPKKAVPRAEAQKSDKLFVRALPATCTPDSFKQYWRQFGNVTDATLMMDKETGRHRGFGFVNYDSRETVEKVLAAAPHYMDGQLLEVKRAQTKGEARRADYGVNTNQFMMNTMNGGGPVINPNGPAGGAGFDPNAMSKMFTQMGWGGWNPMMMGGMMGGMGMNMGGFGMPGMMGMPGMPTMGMGGAGFDGMSMGAGADVSMNAGGSQWTAPMNQSMRGGGRGGFRGSGRGGHLNAPTGPAAMRGPASGGATPEGGSASPSGGNGAAASGTGPQRNKGSAAGYHAEQLRTWTGLDEQSAVRYILRFKDVQTATNAFLDGQTADPLPELADWAQEDPQPPPLIGPDSGSPLATHGRGTATQQASQNTELTLWNEPRAPPQSPTADIDLTKDSDDADLARAVAMSRQESNVEDDELNQALAQSLCDLSKEDASTHTRGAVAAVSIAPEARVRAEHTPAVLRSGSALMGDLAAYVQCLYAIPTWRKAVFDFRPSQDELSCNKDLSALWHGGSSDPLSSSDSTAPTEIWVILALQRLFAAMRDTKRSFLHTTELEETMGRHVEELVKPGADASDFIKGLHEELAAIISRDTTTTAPDGRFIYCGVRVSKSDPTVDVTDDRQTGIPSSAVTDAPVRAFGESPDDLYSALRRAFSDTPDKPNEGMGLLTTVPDTLAIRLRRELVTSLDQFGSNRTRQHFKPPAEMYLDRFMLRNRTKIIEASRDLDRLERDLSQLKAAKRNIATTEDGRDGAELVQSGIDLLCRTNDDAHDKSRSNRRDRLLAKLLMIRDTVTQSMREYDERVRALEAESVALLNDDASMKQTGPFELCSILMRNGLNGRGSSWAVVRDERGRWWRTSDFVAEEVTLEDVLTDRSGLHMGAGATFLFYQSKQTAAKHLNVPSMLKDLVLLDNYAFAAELPLDLTQSWQLPPKPQIPVEDNSGLAEPVEEILAFSREEAASPTPVDVVPETMGDVTPTESRAVAETTLRLRGGSAQHSSSNLDSGADDPTFDEDDDDYDENDEDEVELGLLKPMPDTWDVDYAVGKVGGIPRYLDPRSPLDIEDVACRLCGAIMPLLLQINSPDDSKPHAQARALYVFICASARCNAGAAGPPVRIWRSQMPSPNAFFPHTAETQSLRAELASLGLAAKPELARSPWKEWDIESEPEPYEESYLPTAVPAADSNGAEDAVEPDTKTGVDSTFLRFQERIERLPEQVLRFYRLPDVQDPEPLWANESKVSPDDLPACPLCGGPRKIEFQIVSTLLNFVKDDNLTFDSLLAFTCALNCPIPDRPNGLTGWAEECVVNQSFANEGLLTRRSMSRDDGSAGVDASDGPAHDPQNAPTLDLTGLADDDAFQSEAAWLNAVLASTGGTDTTELAALDHALSGTLAQLNTLTHDTSNLVDRTIDDISRSVPRLAFDLQLMRENALLLQFTLDSLRKRSGPGTDSTSQISKVMDKLRVLDLIKSRMEASRDVLREAESWSNLESEVTGLVGEQQFVKAAERLEEAARSMVVFQNTAEYEQRRALMVSLQNQLEASLSSPLVTAINSRDIKACKQFHGIFAQIQRDAEFTAYYFGSRRAKLVDMWTKAGLNEHDEQAGTDLNSHKIAGSASTALLMKFYDDLLSLVQEERTYIPAVFPDAAQTLSALVQTTLEGLSPSFSQRLSDLVEHHGAVALPELIQSYRAAEGFALAFDQLARQIDQSADRSSSTPSDNSPAVQTPSRGPRRHSHRLSASKRLSSRSISFTAAQAPSLNRGNDEPLQAWETALFEPYLDWQVGYADLEGRYLDHELARAIKGRDVLSFMAGPAAARQLWDLANGVYASLEDSFGRLLAFTHGYAAASLIQVMDGHLASFLEHFRAQVAKANETKSQGSISGREVEEDETAFEGLEYSAEDWEAVQRGLRLLSTCRALHERLIAFENKLQGRVAILAQTIRSARLEPEYTLPGTTKGGLTILRQSALNSAELADLLDPFETETSRLPMPLLLSKARGATAEFTRTTQMLLHDIILAPLLAHVAGYANLATWSITTDPSARGYNDLSIPTFSLSPTDAITRVGEGLFNLPRLFEVYAEDDALGFSIETLPHVDVEALRALRQESEAIQQARTTTHRLSESMSGDMVQSQSLHRSASSQSRPVGTLAAGQQPPLQVGAETVIATWLSSLTLSVLKHFASVILPSFSRLSRHGAAQLVSDLDYISNVARALDVETLEDLAAWREAAACEDKDKLADANIPGEIADKVARIRGWRRTSLS